MKYSLEQNALNYLKELLSNKEIYCEELEDSYVMLKMACDERNKLKQEKQDLIKWLEEEIDILNKEIIQCNNECIKYKCEKESDIYKCMQYKSIEKRKCQEILDKVKE